jgi:glycosyltransferase involved in cell wall biosynthesis
MKDKKIALFMLPVLTQGGGAEKYFIDLARNFSERGIQTDIVTMNEKFFRKFGRVLHIFRFGNFFGKIPLAGREKEEFIRKQLGKAEWIKASWSDLKKCLGKYDIIYTKNEIVDLLLLKLKGYKKLPPIIVGVHTPIFYPNSKSFFSKLHNFLYQGFFYKWLLGGVRCVHLSNKFTFALVKKKFRVRSELVYYPFSCELIQKASEEIKSDIHFDENKINIVFISRLTEQKGIRSLAEIINRLAEKEEIVGKISMHIFGIGDEENENIVKFLKNKYPFVNYYGHVENRFIPNILSRQNLFITTSKWETLPFNVLEAQALGIPVVAFDIPGPSDIIVDGKTGFLVKDENEFAEKIIQLALGKADIGREEIIKNIEHKFNPDKIYSQLAVMFKNELSK